MSGQIMEAFKEKKTFNIFELVLRLQVDRNELEKTLDTLLSHGKLRIERKKLSHTDNSPGYKYLRTRSSIRGFYGATYVLNE